jgi:hypothetical protein
MKRAVVLFALVALAGCASEMAHSPAADEAKPGEKATDTAIHGDAAHGRPPESSQQVAAPEPERTVSLPEALEVQRAPALPERPRVAVAFVRGGKLARRPDALRRLGHELESACRIEALERFEDAAPEPLGLDALSARAAKQGAALLLVDARATEDGERTTYLVAGSAPWKAVAFARPTTEAPRGEELVARLVRASRQTP